MANRFAKIGAGFLGGCLGCVLGPLVGFPVMSVLADSVDEADVLALLLMFAFAGAGIGLAVGVRLAGGSWPWWWRWWRGF
jgi:hypothetical protein